VTGEVWGTVDLGGGALAGSNYYSDAFVASYTGSGAYRWGRRMGAAMDNDQGLGIAADASGRVTVSGEFRATADFGGATKSSSGRADVFVAQYASNGAYRWVEGWGGADDDQGRSLDAAGTGQVAAGGFFRSTATILGQTLTSAGSTDAYLVHLLP
jgi:hypothetical protein